MSDRPSVPGRSEAASTLDAAFWFVVAGAAVLVALVGLALMRGAAAGPSVVISPSPSVAATVDAAAFLEPSPRPAPALALTDHDGRPFDPASFRDRLTLVFFGYTHCPDVCPATMGTVTEAISAFGPGAAVIFVTIDPERDTVAWMKEYVRFLPTGFSGLTGTVAEVRTAADAWGVRYARVDTGDPDSYTMSHTAAVYVVDGDGRLRARFPFGTRAQEMTATLQLVAGGGSAAGPSPTVGQPGTVGPAPGPGTAIGVELVSGSVWAGGSSPVILALADGQGRLTEAPEAVSVTVLDSSGTPAGAAAPARIVRPRAIETVYLVADVDLPTPGWWRLSVEVTLGGERRTGSLAISALDPGTTAALGSAAPAVRSPTLDDVGGLALAVTTDYLPDLRLSRTSTVDALAAGEPFVLVIDSARFKVTPACGTALQLAKSLLDRWPTTTFIHLEPYRYSIVTDTAVLEGSLVAPTLVPAAAAWGIGGSPWGAGSMPWVFIVDGDGTVAARYQGVVGSEDIDVILSMLGDG